MKLMETWKWVLPVLLLALGVTRGWAEQFAIKSFDGSGQLTFNEISTATVYRVEWAPTPNGPWTNFTGAAGAALDEIVAKGSGIVTCSVPMCYRVVVAAVTNTALIVLIPAGSFVVQNDDPDYGEINYLLSVEVAFYMDRTEVTKAKWDSVYAWALTHGYSFDDNMNGEGPHGQGRDVNHPVQTVNWYDCVKWCNARSEREKKTPCYTVGGDVYKAGHGEPSCDFSANGYRLPTNTEWEYAARCGQTFGRFPWVSGTRNGDTIQHARANYNSYSWLSFDTSPTRGYHPTYKPDDADPNGPGTSPVGVFPSNGYNLHDMAGNVFEWCNDTSGLNRPIRGGSWADSADYACCVLIITHPPYTASKTIGFRTVRR